MLNLSSTLSSHLRRASELAVAHVVPDASICMQCGTCSYSCPMGINVRAYAWRGQPIDESYCLSCGQCIARCPRQALRFAPIDLPKATGG